VYFVYANPAAITADVRYTEKDLNRCFYASQNGTTYEEKRAVELMSILDESDALLDLHACNNPKTQPFAITDNGLDVVAKMRFPIVATNFDTIEPGATDGYMLQQDKIGICLECGYVGDSKKMWGLAYASTMQFLQYFDAVNTTVPYYNLDQKILKVTSEQIVPNESFKLADSFKDFQDIPKGTLIATDSNKEYKAEKNQVILFAVQNKKPGEEAYVIGEWVE